MTRERLQKHPRKDQCIKIRMTLAERRMLRSLAVRSKEGSDSGLIRRWIRDEFAKRAVHIVIRNEGEDRT